MLHQVLHHLIVITKLFMSERHWKKCAISETQTCPEIVLPKLLSTLNLKVFSMLTCCSNLSLAVISFINGRSVYWECSLVTKQKGLDWEKVANCLKNDLNLKWDRQSSLEHRAHFNKKELFTKCDITEHNYINFNHTKESTSWSKAQQQKQKQKTLNERKSN